MSMQRRRRLFALLVILCLPLGVLGESRLQGHWKGAIELPGTPLEVEVQFDSSPGGEWTGTISIPLQQARDLPLTAVSQQEKSVRFAIAGIPGEPVFSGEMDAEGAHIRGTFTQGGKEFPFQLQRADDPLLQAKTALAGFPAVIRRGLSDLHVPGVAMAVMRYDKAVFTGGFGYRDLEKKLPMTTDTLLAIGSSTKAFTTFALGVMVDRGRMDWDKPVRDYIPWFRMHDAVVGERITPRDLVTHRSGLPRHDLVWYNNSDVTREELVRRLAYLDLSADLRQKFQYNNLMFLTAGYLLEVLTDHSWEKAIRELIFSPLDMTRSNFSVADSQKDADFAQPYREEKDKLVKIPFRDISIIGPAGAINSSVNEMSHWLMVHLNKGRYSGRSVINPVLLEDMHRSYMPTGQVPRDPRISSADYGLGWFIDHYRGHRRVHHGGNIDGFTCQVSLLPDDGLGFVVLANKNGAALPELLIRTATDRLLGLEPVDWIADAAKQRGERQTEVRKAEQKKGERRVLHTRLSHNLDEYAGVYRHPGYGDLVVSRRGGGLQFVFNRIVTELRHWHYDTFTGKALQDPTFADMKLTFRTDENGFIHDVEGSFEPMTAPIVFVRQPDPRYREAGYLQRFAGEYVLTGRKAEVRLKGNVLTLHVPGQPVLELVPDLGGEFFFKQVRSIRLKFTTDKTGVVTGLEVYQPQGTFTARRVKAE